MKNPWANITVSEYEGHMKFVKQHNLLNNIFKEQISGYEYNTICILGVGCGNGLEHIKPNTIVCGYDINDNFLTECRKRYENTNYELKLKQVDLTDPNVNICTCDMMISNLVLEYIGMYNFASIIEKSKPNYVSVIIQKTTGNKKAISESPYATVFDKVSVIQSEIMPQNLTMKMELMKYHQMINKKYEISQFKSFIRLDYCKNNSV